MGPDLRRDGEGIFDHSSVDADFFTRAFAGMTKNLLVTPNSFLVRLSACQRGHGGCGRQPDDLVLVSGCQPLYQPGSKVRCPNGEMALTFGGQELSGARYGVENAGAPTDLLDDLPKQRVCRLLIRPYPAAREEEPTGSA